MPSSIMEDSSSSSAGTLRLPIEALQADFERTPRMLRDEADIVATCAEHYNKEELSDIILEVGEKRFHAHKFVLAKSSDIFKMMLFDRRFKESERLLEGDELSVLELSESSECQQAFGKFLRFLYTGEIEVACDSVVGILCLADKYNTAALRRLVVSFMVEMTKSPRVSTALAWYPWAKALNLEALLEECRRTIAWSYQDIIQSEEFLTMDQEFLVDMLQSSELVVRNEYVIYEAVYMWLLHESRIESLHENATHLLPLVRFPQMLVDQIFRIENGELASSAECKDLVKDLLSKAYRFRAICHPQQSLSHQFGEDKFFEPREYTDLIVDVVKIQNTLRFGIQVDVKMYVGPAPNPNRDGDWKLTYRKNNNTWSVQIFPHETSLIQGEARVQACAILYNETDKVLNVCREEPCVATRGSTITFSVELPEDNSVRCMAVLIKPLP